MDLVKKYFQHLDHEQLNKINQMLELYEFWNRRINVISRKDIEHLIERHILHSFAIAKFTQFTVKQSVIDIGTGGGFPGIPLSILFPETRFHLIDSIAKKIKVVKEISNELKLANVSAEQIKSTMHHKKYDFIVSRAVTAFPNFVKQTSHLLKTSKNNESGIYYLKGGDFEEEIKPFGNKISLFNLSDIYDEDFFTTKKLIYLKKTN